MGMTRLAPISTAALEAMRAERQARVGALLAEIRDIDFELSRRREIPAPPAKLQLVRERRESARHPAQSPIHPSRVG